VIHVQAKGGKVDLARLALSSGQAAAVEVGVRLEPIELGSQTYDYNERETTALLDVSRTTSGYALRLRLSPKLEGPCVRCLEDSEFPLEIDAREVDQPGTDDDELDSPYVSDQVVDVAHWANDAVVLALPAKPVCREDCKGLCAVCGASLNDANPADHEHGGGGDPRMAKLKDLKLE
jgi:uncharacterized protein